MVVHKRKKLSRYRGSKTHGGGAKKKRRGSGHRGGTGMSGSGKRADSKKPSIWKNAEYFGRHGFKSKTRSMKIVPVNIVYLEENLDKLVLQKLINKENDSYAVELEKLGYNKLLGKGKVNRKFKIKAKYASENAMKAVKEAGGEVILG